MGACRKVAGSKLRGTMRAQVNSGTRRACDATGFLAPSVPLSHRKERVPIMVPHDSTAVSAPRRRGR